MATVTRSTVPKPAEPEVVADIIVRGGQPISLPTSLPLAPRKITRDINNHPILVLGPPGCGKTSLTNQEEGVLTLQWDKPNDTYGFNEQHVVAWEQMQTWATLLTQHALECERTGKKFPYRRVQIDGMGTMSRVCTDWTCQNKLGGILHPNAEKNYGLGSDVVNRMFTEVIDKFLALPCGVVFVSHVKNKEVETDEGDGAKIKRLSTDMRGAMEGILVGKCHIVINIGYLPNKARIARIRGDDSYLAKCNLKGCFMTPDGRYVEEVFLDKVGPEKAWANIMRAFRNEQRWATVKEMVEMGKPKAPPPSPPPASGTAEEEPPLT